MNREGSMILVGWKEIRLIVSTKAFLFARSVRSPGISRCVVTVENLDGKLSVGQFYHFLHSGVCLNKLFICEMSQISRNQSIRCNCGELA